MMVESLQIFFSLMITALIGFFMGLFFHYLKKPDSLIANDISNIFKTSDKDTKIKFSKDKNYDINISDEIVTSKNWDSKIVLKIINLFENNKLYIPELGIIARSLSIMGDLLRKPFDKADIASVNYMTTSPQWVEAREKAFNEELNNIKTTLTEKVNKKH